MKEKELRSYATCGYCHKLIGEASIPAFAVVEVTTYHIDLAATQRQQGLGLMVGAPLAMVMGTDEDLAQPVDSFKVSMCWSCMDKLPEPEPQP